MNKQEKLAAVFGAADGLTLAVSLILSLRLHQPVIFHAVLGGGLGELVGMTAGLWLSSEGGRSSFWQALACGVAGFAACLLPGLPFVFTAGAVALALACAVALALGAVICWLRPERGWLAIAETYGVLVTAAILCFLASFIH